MPALHRTRGLVMSKKTVATVKSAPAKKNAKKAPAFVIPTKAQGKGKGKQAPVVIASHANGADFSESRPGVLAFFVESLLAAHGKGGLTKKELLALAVAKFDDRTPEKLKSTIAMQLPSGFYIEKGYPLTIVNSERGRAFSLSASDKSAGDAWRLAKRTNPDAPKPAKHVVEGSDDE